MACPCTSPTRATRIGPSVPPTPTENRNGAAHIATKRNPNRRSIRVIKFLLAEHLQPRTSFRTDVARIFLAQRFFCAQGRAESESLFSLRYCYGPFDPIICKLPARSILSISAAHGIQQLLRIVSHANSLNTISTFSMSGNLFRGIALDHHQVCISSPWRRNRSLSPVAQISRLHSEWRFGSTFQVQKIQLRWQTAVQCRVDRRIREGHRPLRWDRGRKEAILRLQQKHAPALSHASTAVPYRPREARGRCRAGSNPRVLA